MGKLILVIILFLVATFFMMKKYGSVVKLGKEYKNGWSTPGFERIWNDEGVVRTMFFWHHVFYITLFINLLVLAVGVGEIITVPLALSFFLTFFGLMFSRLFSFTVSDILQTVKILIPNGIDCKVSKANYCKWFNIVKDESLYEGLYLTVLAGLILLQV